MNHFDQYPYDAIASGSSSDMPAVDHTDMLGRPAEPLRMLVDRADREPYSLTDEDAVVLEFFGSNLPAHRGAGREDYAA